MRSDMAKVIVERPRVSGGHGKGRRMDARVLDPETAVSREGMRRAHASRKQLNENLAPLQRYILSNVGRPWDKVLSEMSEHIRLDNAVQRHIMQHVYQFVHLHVEERDGRLYELPSHNGNRNSPLDDQYNGNPVLYVCPRTGLLKRVKIRKNWRREQRDRLRMSDPDVVVVNDLTQYRRIDGMWYRVEFAYVGKGVTIPFGKDACGVLVAARLWPATRYGKERLEYHWLREAYGFEDRYATRKIQLGKREIRRLKLPEVT